MAETTTKQLVLWLIAILVFVIVVVAVTPVLRDKVIDWVKSFPEYKYEHEEEIDVSQLSKDELAALGCKIIVAAIGREQRGIIFGRNERDLFLYDSENEKWFKSNLYVDAEDENNMEIKTDDVVLGSIKNKEVSIKEEVFKKIGVFSAYKVAKKFPEDKFLFNLDKAIYIGGGFHLICREKEVKDFDVAVILKSEEKIEELKKIGHSNILVLVFDDDVNDEVKMTWFFERKSVGARIIPNGDRNIETEWIFSKDDKVFESKEINKKIYKDDINIIKNLLDSKTPLELSENLQKALKTKRVSFDNDGRHDLTLSQINIMLYSTSTLPESLKNEK